jgi:hypothetical protein
MFKVKHYSVCPVTGFTEYEIEFTIWNRASRTFKESYKHESDAIRRMERLKTDYLLFHLEDLVHECSTMVELGISVNSKYRALALEKCKSGVHYFQDKQLNRIAELIMQMKPLLEQILPAETNSQYPFLYSVYINITTMAKSLVTINNDELCPV